jgi:adenosylcobinamide-phosphate synthase
MPFETTLLVLGMALVFDAVFGYPDPVYRAIGHPVTWIGRLIGGLDSALNRPQLSFSMRKLTGALALCLVIATPASIAWSIESELKSTWAGTITLAFIASTLIASRSLHDHVQEVAHALDASGIAGGRIAVAKIVGRDPEALDEHGVARAAIESLAENASDGVVAPALWFAILGLPGLAAYKAINTADSMIGHRTPRHEAFGWAAAKLDDLVNLPASRLTGLFFAAAAWLQTGTSPSEALAAMSRDASKHRSPNAGWPESAMAGALGLKLNGPRSYGGVPSTDAYMGNGRAEATAHDIRRALALAGMSWCLMTAAVIVAYFIARS